LNIKKSKGCDLIGRSLITSKDATLPR